MLEQLKSYTPLRDEVFSSLRNAILDGRFHSEERLVEKKLAQTLSISRTPIREALRKLELEGLVSHAPRRGAVVVGGSQDDAAEIYTIRAALEGLAARRAAGRRTDGDIAQLNHLLNTMNQYVQTFHQTFTTASKCSRLCQMISSLWDYVKNFEQSAYSIPARLQASCNEHRRIVEAIEHQDEYAARTHILHAKDMFLEGIAQKECET